MSKRPQFAPCVFLAYSSRDNLPAGSVILDVSSYADHPFCTFSPMWAHGGIPIPGMPGQTSDSVEGIWQGLKVIRGKTAPRLFRGKGQKRGGKPSGHQFGNKLLDIVEARQKIYKVAYEWILVNRVDQALIEQMIETACQGVTQYIHDVGDNGDIGNANEPLAHAALVVQFINRRCAERASRE
jgi:hypothetical protein